jgi:lipopolysaccharide/colanic/teichoic acid biosynthesis glycosyltransferase
MVDCSSSKVIESLKVNSPVMEKPIYDALVRGIDLLVSAIGLVACSPVLLTIAVLVKISDGGPVFFRQERLGKAGRPISIIKFRTMVVNAEQIGNRWRMAKNDVRVTRVGRLLREYHMDELPQLFNVLRGEMSLVGPRPALVFQKDYYEPWELPRLMVVPGITGLSQVSGGNSLNWDQRIIIDVYYVRHRNIGMYARILSKTFLQLFLKHGVYNQDGKVQGWTRPVPDWYREHASPPQRS